MKWSWNNPKGQLQFIEKLVQVDRGFRSAFCRLYESPVETCLGCRILPRPQFSGRDHVCRPKQDVSFATHIDIEGAEREQLLEQIENTLTEVYAKLFVECFCGDESEVLTDGDGVGVGLLFVQRTL